MSRSVTLVVVSDIHYASAAEQARGDDFEIRGIRNPFLRIVVNVHRRYFWMHRPLRQGHLLDRFLERVDGGDYVIANGDYSCDTAFVGVSDDAACASAQECLGRLRKKFGGKFRATVGDHELGKFSLVGGRGGMRLASYHRTRSDLGLEPFWKIEAGRYVVIGIASSLVAFPVYGAESLSAERAQWEQVCRQHLEEISATFAALNGDQRVLLFCHDPTALPFLWRVPAVRERLGQVEATIIGRLHSPLVLWKTRLLAGMPHVRSLGPWARRITAALRDARSWKPFRVQLCPALAGIELLKDGGFLTVELDESGARPAKIERHRLPR